jgi:hypothetical protein
MMSLESKLVSCLTDDLRRAPYRGHPNPLRGHCYVASEALYHLRGGKAAGLKPMFIQHEGAPHWFLVDTKKREIIDLTAGQFKTPVPYSRAKGKGFLTSKPSKRAAELIRRATKASRDPKPKATRLAPPKAGFKRSAYGLVHGDFYILSAPRGGTLYKRATYEDYENQSLYHPVHRLVGGPWSYGMVVQDGPIAELRRAVDEYLK